MCANKKWRTFYTLRLKTLREKLLKNIIRINYCEPEQGMD